MSIRDEKFHRMNRIMAALEVGPRSIDELLKTVFEPPLPQAARRTLGFDLSGLQILGKVIFEGGLYHSTETRTTYKNKAEYELTIKHSHRLMREFGTMSPEHLVNRLVQKLENDTVEKLAYAIKHDIKPREDRVRYFLSHLKTKYYMDIYQPILRYKEIEEKYDKIKQILKTTRVSGIAMSYTGWDKDEIVEIDPNDPVFEGPFGIPKALTYGELGEPIAGMNVRTIDPKDKVPVFKQILDNPGICREYINLKYDIASKVYGLLGFVQNGSPLDGYCDACPLRHLKIKD